MSRFFNAAAGKICRKDIRRALCKHALGTSGTKTVLFDRQGTALASQTVEYPLYQPQNGWAEQDPEDWVRAAFTGIRAVLDKQGITAEDVAGIGLSGQMHGLVLLSEGACMILNPWYTHAFHCEGERANGLFIQISPDVIKGYFPMAGAPRFEQISLPDVVSEEILCALRETMADFGVRYFAMEPVYEFACMQRLNRIFELLLKHVPWTVLSSKEALHESCVRQRLERIVDYVAANYQSKLLLRDLAQREHLSASLLSHFICEHLNMSFQSYLTLIRFEHAKILLDTTRLPAGGISRLSGFSDPKFLKKIFAAQLSCTPEQYRKRQDQPAQPRTAAEDVTTEHIYSDADALACLKQYAAKFQAQAGEAGIIPPLTGSAVRSSGGEGL